jgi:hypothetical protein
LWAASVRGTAVVAGRSTRSLGSLRTIVAIRAHYRQELALKQLETALQLYFANGDRGSIITLAGAADEVFGKYLERADRKSSFKSMVAAIIAIRERIFGEALSPEEVKEIADRANSARNSLKHIGQTDIVKFDLEVEARDMLFRAIDNYWSLERKLTPAMERFQSEVQPA